MHNLTKRLLDILRSKLQGSSSQPNAQDHAPDPSEGFAGFDEEKTQGRSQSSFHPPNDERKRHLNALELTSFESMQQVKSAYQRLSRTYHPDRFVGDEEKLKIATEVQAQINAAYQYFQNEYFQNEKHIKR